MSSTRIWPSSRPRVPTSTPANAATPSGSAIVDPSVLPYLSAYPDYVDGEVSGPHWDAPLALSFIHNNISTLPLAFVGPLTQIADVVSSTIDAVKLMGANKEECAYLVSRVLRLLRSLVDNMKASDVSFADGTPTAASLIALRRYVYFTFVARPLR
jgi:hypothetical protein